ncbi:MAG: DUF2652 domain-containing protein, partial [Saprospiraceae bacterium]|nr:DUF2652 domain-containing protein [Saprospiraceae bacterium]
GIARAREMLQIIVDSNDLGLELCEIEGDAVFFYLRSGLPSFSRLLTQIRKTFVEFQDYLQRHALTDMLGIKFFVHVGACQSITVGGRKKLFGLDVIMIHRLLKGRFDANNYLLITRDAARILSYDGDHARRGTVLLEHIGRVDYMVLGEEVLWSHEPIAKSPASVWDRALGLLELTVSELHWPFRYLSWRPLQHSI